MKLSLVLILGLCGCGRPNYFGYVDHNVFTNNVLSRSQSPNMPPGWHAVYNGYTYHWVNDKGYCSIFDSPTYQDCTNTAWTVYAGKEWEKTNNNWQVVTNL